MSRVVLRCQSCRHSLLDTFAGLAGISIPSIRSHPPFQLKRRVPGPQQQRSYGPSYRLREAVHEASQQASETIDGDVPAPTESPTNTSPESVPWYLRIQSPPPPAPISPILALQEIPPLPSNSPSILQPILEHLFNTIGLDNLSLLDLRSLHPPPALGANLIMIVGTARSVKHLNVSADRFCRWLRTEWRLRPYADGLLGRNELKLKLRRKARREKLMGLVGGKEVGNPDDGITTGWVCVNVGMVDEDLVPKTPPTSSAPSEADAASSTEPPIEEEEEDYKNPSPEEQEALRDADEGYAGFGSRITSPRIVVQMFTEEKRLEMDLEGLWEHRNTRREQTAERRQGEVEEKVGSMQRDTLAEEDESAYNDSDDEQSLADGGRWESKRSTKGIEIDDAPPHKDGNANKRYQHNAEHNADRRERRPKSHGNRPGRRRRNVERAPAALPELRRRDDAGDRDYSLFD